MKRFLPKRGRQNAQQVEETCAPKIPTTECEQSHARACSVNDVIVSRGHSSSLSEDARNLAQFDNDEDPNEEYLESPCPIMNDNRISSSSGGDSSGSSHRRTNQRRSKTMNNSHFERLPSSTQSEPAQVEFEPFPSLYSQQSHVQPSAKEAKDMFGDGSGFNELYTLGRPLRRNADATIVRYQATHKLSTEKVEVKVVNIQQINPLDEVALIDEINALNELVGCPFIVELFDVFQETQHTFLVTERMRGGTLMKALLTKSRYSEQDARQVCFNLLSALAFCHGRRIANRNLKHESILLGDNDVDVKLSDFCLAKKVVHPNSLRTLCGTEGYMAPEILQQQPEYDVQCDMWSLGVTIYTLMCGYQPFNGSSLEISHQIRYGKYEFHDHSWKHISRDAKHFICRLLTVDPIMRISSSRALRNRWLTGESSNHGYHHASTV